MMQQSHTSLGAQYIDLNLSCFADSYQSFHHFPTICLLSDSPRFINADAVWCVYFFCSQREMSISWHRNPAAIRCLRDPSDSCFFRHTLTPCIVLHLSLWCASSLYSCSTMAGAWGYCLQINILSFSFPAPDHSRDFLFFFWSTDKFLLEPGKKSWMRKSYWYFYSHTKYSFLPASDM